MNDDGPAIDSMRSPHYCQAVMNVHNSSAWTARPYVSKITNVPLLRKRTLFSFL